MISDGADSVDCMFNMILHDRIHVLVVYLNLIGILIVLLPLCEELTLAYLQH